MPRSDNNQDSTDDNRDVPPLPDLSSELRVLSESDTRDGENFSAMKED